MKTPDLVTLEVARLGVPIRCMAWTGERIHHQPARYSFSPGYAAVLVARGDFIPIKR